MSYRVELDLPSCCAEHLHLAAEINECTPEEMLVHACMVGLLAFGAYNLTSKALNIGIICDATSTLLNPPMRERWE